MAVDPRKHRDEDIKDITESILGALMRSGVTIRESAEDTAEQIGVGIERGIEDSAKRIAASSVKITKAFKDLAKRIADQRISFDSGNIVVDFSKIDIDSEDFRKRINEVFEHIKVDSGIEFDSKSTEKHFKNMLALYVRYADKLSSIGEQFHNPALGAFGKKQNAQAQLAIMGAMDEIQKAINTATGKQIELPFVFREDAKMLQNTIAVLDGVLKAEERVSAQRETNSRKLSEENKKLKERNRLLEAQTGVVVDGEQMPPARKPRDKKPQVDASTHIHADVAGNSLQQLRKDAEAAAKSFHDAHNRLSDIIEAEGNLDEQIQNARLVDYADKIKAVEEARNNALTSLGSDYSKKSEHKANYDKVRSIIQDLIDKEAIFASGPQDLYHVQRYMSAIAEYSKYTKAELDQMLEAVQREINRATEETIDTYRAWDKNQRDESGLIARRRQLAKEHEEIVRIYNAAATESDAAYKRLREAENGIAPEVLDNKKAKLEEEARRAEEERRAAEERAAKEREEAEKRALELAKKRAEEESKITAEKQKQYGYHAGKFRDDGFRAEGLFQSTPGRSTGFYGTGTYMTDEKHLNEITAGQYGRKPLSVIDPDMYNLFDATNDKIADQLHRFLRGITSKAWGVKGENIKTLYNEFKNLFPKDKIITYEDFKSLMSELQQYVKDNKDKYPANKYMDSVSTKFMKHFGYEGVDTRGTEHADTTYGTVIYNLKEESVILREITDELQKQEIIAGNIASIIEAQNKTKNSAGGYHEMSREGAAEYLRENGDNKLWNEWYSQASDTARTQISEILEKDLNMRNAALNQMWDEYRRINGDISFEEFLYKEIPLYRGEKPGQEDPKKALSFSMVSDAAQQFGDVLQILLRPIDTLGMANPTVTPQPEAEVMVLKDAVPGYADWKKSLVEHGAGGEINADAVKMDTDELVAQYQRILSTIKEWQTLYQKLGSIGKGDAKKMREQVMSLLNNVSPELASMIGGKFAESFAQGFEGANMKDILAQISRIASDDLLGNASEQISILEGVDLDKLNFSELPIQDTQIDFLKEAFEILKQIAEKKKEITKEETPITAATGDEGVVPESATDAAPKVEAEADAIAEVGVAAEKAAKSKKKFASANKEVADSAKTSVEGLDAETDKLEDVDSKAESFATRKGVGVITGIGNEAMKDLNLPVSYFGEQGQDAVQLFAKLKSQVEELTGKPVIIDFVSEVNDDNQLEAVGATLKYVNEEAGVTIRQFYQIGRNADGVLVAVQSQEKATLAASKAAKVFNTEMQQKLALEQIKTLKAQMGSLEIDLTEVMDAAKAINDKASLEHFNLALRSAKEHAKQLKTELRGQNTLDTIASMERALLTLPSRLEEIHRRLNNIGDIDGASIVSDVLYSINDEYQRFLNSNDSKEKVGLFRSLTSSMVWVNAEMRNLSAQSSEIKKQETQTEVDELAKQRAAREAYVAWWKKTLDEQASYQNYGKTTANSVERKRDVMQGEVDALGVTNPEILAKMDAYTKKVQEVIDLRSQFANNPESAKDPALVKQFQKAAVEAERARRGIKAVIDEEQKMMQMSLEQGFDPVELTADQISNLENEMIAHARATAQGRMEIKGWNDDHTKMYYTVTNSKGVVEEMTMALGQGTNTMYQYRTATKETGTLMQQVFKGIKVKAKELLSFVIGGGSVYKVIELLRQGIQYVREIDLALTELKKVTDETEETYDKFLETAAKTGARLGSTISAVTEATATFAKLGYTMEQATEMAEAAIVYKNVGDNIASTEDAADSIISTMKGFKLEATESMRIVDRFNEVGNRFAITSQGIGEALRLSASALSEGGNSLDESIGLITAAM